MGELGDLQVGGHRLEAEVRHLQEGVPAQGGGRPQPPGLPQDQGLEEEQNVDLPLGLPQEQKVVLPQPQEQQTADVDGRPG